MIQFTKSYKTSDGQVFGNIDEAKIHELDVILSQYPGVAKQIMDQKEKIIDILTTTPNSKPKARAINGGVKKRPFKTVITDANTSTVQTPNTPV